MMLDFDTYISISMGTICGQIYPLPYMYMVESFSKELSIMLSFETESNKKYLLPVAIIK